MRLRFLANYPRLRPLLLAVFTDVLGMSIILPFLSILAIQYNVDALMLGFVISSNAIFGFIFSPILGKMSDKFGRKPVMLLAQAGTLAGFLVLMFSNSIYLLLLARIVDGVFSGQVAICNAVVGDVVPAQDRGKLMTTIGGAATFAYIFGPSMSGFIYQLHGTFGVGILAVAVSSANLVLTASWLSESNPKKVYREGMVQRASTTENAGTTSLTQTGKTGTKSSTIIRNKRALYVLTLICVIDLTEFIFETTLSLFVFRFYGMSITEIGLMYTSMAIFQVTFRVFVFSPLHKKLGDVKTVILGGAVYVSFFILLGLNLGFWYVLLLMLYFTLGMVLTRGILFGFASQAVDAGSQGKMMGVASSLDSLGQMVGPFIGTYLLLNQTGSLYLFSLAGLSIVALAMSLRLFRFGFDAKSNN